MQKHVIICFVFLIQYCHSEWDDISIICPNQCVCQHSHFNNLPVSRWIQHFDNIITEGETIQEAEDEFSSQNTNEEFENEFSHLDNPLVKLIMCMVQADTSLKTLMQSIPQDVQALILLYTGSKTNYTVLTSDISLPDLEILELRGNADRDLSLVIDVPLTKLQYVNFEAVRISSAENLPRRTSPIDPAQNFSYVPFSEKAAYNVTVEVKDEVEIIPYEMYVMELKRSRAISLYGWTELRVLRIHDCSMDELEWEIFDGLDKLQHLSLEHNGIKIVPPFAFFGVPHIKTLSLAWNSILDLNYRALAGLLDLISLNLSHNEISKMSELTFPPFPNLRVIDFRHNAIKYIFPSTFAVLNETKALYLGDPDSAFTIAGGNSFKELTELTSISIFNINQTVFSQNLLQNLKSLEILRFKGRIKYIEFDAFAEVVQLRELRVSECQIEELSMDAFYGVPNIEIIDLSKNKLKFLPPGVFDEKRHLKEIYLNGNELQTLHKNFFEDLPTNVKILRLINNPWTCSCAQTKWKQGLINRARTTKPNSNCKSTKNKHQAVKCKSTETHYVYNNKLSPRCAGPTAELKNRSVFYALRKVLMCPVEPRKRLNKTRNKNKHLRDEDEEKRTRAKLSREHYQDNIADGYHHPKYAKVNQPKHHLGKAEQMDKVSHGKKHFSNSLNNNIL